MRVCIRCNPVTALLKDANGEEYCFIHGKDFVLEVQPDPAGDEPEAGPKEPEAHNFVMTQEVSDERHES